MRGLQVNAPAQLLTEVRRRPLLVVGGLVALFALANLGDLLNRNQAPAPDSGTGDGTTDPTTTPTDPTAAASDPGFTSPSYGYGGYAGFDPFAYDQSTGTQAVAQYTADGCVLPKPTIPTGQDGKGDWICDPASKTWVWKWNAAKLSQGGCLLPKPVPPTQYIGKGKYICDPATHQWMWKWNTTPPPAQHKPGKLVLSAGQASTFSVNTSTKVASDAKAWQHAAVTVETGPKLAGVKLPGGNHADMVKMTSGPRQGRWIRVGAGAWTPPT